MLAVITQDTFNNSVSGANAALSASGISNAFGTMAGVTDANGRFVVTLSSTLAQVETVTASLNNDDTLSAQVSSLCGPASAATSSFSVSPNNTIANNSSAITAQITLQDAHGNPVAGIMPSFTTSGSSTSVVSSCATSAAG